MPLRTTCLLRRWDIGSGRIFNDYLLSKLKLVYLLLYNVDIFLVETFYRNHFDRVLAVVARRFLGDFLGVRDHECSRFFHCLLLERGSEGLELFSWLLRMLAETVILAWVAAASRSHSLFACLLMTRVLSVTVVMIQPEPLAIITLVSCWCTSVFTRHRSLKSFTCLPAFTALRLLLKLLSWPLLFFRSEHLF